MSSSNYCFLTCIQFSQEVGQVVWYSHLLQNFPQFIVTHTVKGFGIVNKAEIDVFLELPCFFKDPVDVGNLISGSSVFLKPAWTSASSSQRSSDHKHMDLFMDFLFYSTGLYVFLFMIMLFWLLQICSLFRDQVMWCLFILFMGFMKLKAKEKRKDTPIWMQSSKE